MDASKVFADYKAVVFYDPNDAKTVKQIYHEYGVDVDTKAITYTAFVADLVKSGALKATGGKKPVVFQDPYQLSRDLEETEAAREIIRAYADLSEMHLNRAETVWAGNILMAQYTPKTIELVAKRRIFNAQSLGAKTIVTASVAEYTALKAVATDVEILSLEDLILG